jgi:membrane protease YdiL (CAAX protease family)
VTSPLVYAVAWKRNLYLSMITHVLLNTLGMISLLALAFR